MEVSWGTPKSSIFGFSSVNHPFGGTPIYGNPPYFMGISWNTIVVMKFEEYIVDQTNRDLYGFISWNILVDKTDRDFMVTYRDLCDSSWELIGIYGVFV